MHIASAKLGKANAGLNELKLKMKHAPLIVDLKQRFRDQNFSTLPLNYCTCRMIENY